MKCPVCNIELKMADRQGIEIDYCPQCRGIWLDRGELDKIIERTSALQRAGEPEVAANVYPGKEFRDEDEYRRGYGSDRKKPRRKSFLSDLFDFD